MLRHNGGDRGAMQYAEISIKPATRRPVAVTDLGAIAAYAARTAGWHGPGLSIEAPFAVLRVRVGRAAANSLACRARAIAHMLPDDPSHS